MLQITDGEELQLEFVLEEIWELVWQFFCELWDFLNEVLAFV